MRTARLAIAVAGALVLAPGLHLSSSAQEEQPARPVVRPEVLDQDVVWKIRREALDRSQIMRTLSVLTDVYGPRLTGSPNLRGAQDWVVKQATTWGLKNAHLEEWDFGHPGWLNEKTAVHLVSPVKDSLVVEALAWTPGTAGTVTASAVLVTPPDRPTQQDADNFFKRLRGNLKGRAVLVGQPTKLDVSIDPPAKRRDDNDVRAQFSDNAPPSPFGNPPAPPAAPTDPKTAPLTTDQFQEQLNVFLKEQGAALRINDAGREHGQIRAFNNRTFDVGKAVPTVVMRNEDYGRIARLIESGRAVELEATIVNKDYPEGKTQYNVIAEIPGTERPQEVVMLGGHLDSWHAATGATDNAIGCSTMLEAIRILQTIGVKPRRTIRVALWSGEEQGLRGSVAYVAQHFGTFENPTPEYASFAGYFNIDSGTGRARGYTVFGPPAAANVLRQLAAPFESTGLMGAAATRSRARGGSDHTSFNEIGLPGIGVGQDPIEYGTHTWHTNLDTYERVIESDAQASAMAIATAVYHLAMRDEMLPRFPKAQMPLRPGQAPAPARPTARQ